MKKKLFKSINDCINSFPEELKKNNKKSGKENKEQFLSDFLYALSTGKKRVFEKELIDLTSLEDSKEPIDIITNKGMINILYKAKISSNESIPFSKQYPTSKIFPKRESTASLADIILNTEDSNFCDIYFFDSSVFFSKFKKAEDHNRTGKVCSNFLIGIDVDGFPIGDLSEKEARDKINKVFPISKLIPPHLIVDSGRNGFHAFYIFSEDLSTLENAKDLKKALTLLWGGDLKKLSLGTFFGMPLTTNSKNNGFRRIITNKMEENFYSLDYMFFLLENTDKKYTVVSNPENFPFFVKKTDNTTNDLESISEDEFETNLLDDRNVIITLSELLKGPSCNKVKKKIKDETFRVNFSLKKTKRDKLYSIREINEQRVKDLKKMLKLKDWEIKGYRNTFFVTMSGLLRQLGQDKETNFNSLININKSLKSPYPYSDISRIVDNIYKRKTNKIKNETIFDNLNLPSEVKDFSILSYTKEDKVKRKKRYNQDYYTLTDKAQKAKANKKKKYLAMKNLIKFLKIAPATSLRSLSKKLGFSCCWTKKALLFLQKKASFFKKKEENVFFEKLKSFFVSSFDSFGETLSASNIPRLSAGEALGKLSLLSAAP